eukprot:3270826-Rhodomonas_salina.1
MRKQGGEPHSGGGVQLGRTAAFIACRKFSPACLALLIEASADLNAPACVRPSLPRSFFARIAHAKLMVLEHRTSGRRPSWQRRTGARRVWSCWWGGLTWGEQTSAGGHPRSSPASRTVSAAYACSPTRMALT